MHPSKMIPAFRQREALAAAKPKRATPLRGKDGKFKSAKRRRTKTKSKGA